MNIFTSGMVPGGFSSKYKLDITDIMNKHNILTILDKLYSESVSTLDKLEKSVNYSASSYKNLGDDGFFNYLNMHLNFTSLINNLSGCVESECITSFGVLNVSGIPHLIPAFTGQVITDDIKLLSLIKEDANAFNYKLNTRCFKRNFMEKLTSGLEVEFTKRIDKYTLLRSGNKKTFVFSGSVGCISSDTSGTKDVSVSNRGIYLFNTNEFILTQAELQKLFNCNIFNSSLSTVALRVLKDKTLKEKISLAKHFTQVEIGKMYLTASIVNKKESKTSNTLYKVTVYELLKLVDKSNGTLKEADEIIKNFYKK